MPHIQLSQTSFFSPEFADPSCLPEGTVGWLLRRYAALLFPVWLFARWSGHGRRGRNAWPASVLLTTLILASREGGMSRRAMVRRLKHDIAWRAACGLQIGGKTPSEKTFRRFEKYLRKREPSTGMPRILLLHEHVIRHCLDNDVVGSAATWAMDSTPMWCFGAVHGTFRLLGDGLRSLCGEWARLTGQTVEQLAAAWELPLLLAKSTKGHFRIDWNDADARAGATDRLARWVLEVVERVRAGVLAVRSNKRKGLLRRCRLLAKVVCDDMGTDDEGRLIVVRGVAEDRLVSITDPNARSSRKSKSKPYKGFKVHLLGDLVSGLIASVSVGPANVGDGRVAHRLIHRARRICEEIKQVLGDTAYGGAELRQTSRVLEQVDILAPPQPISRRKATYGSDVFDIDVPGGVATCPAGVTVSLRSGRQTRYFSWKKADCQGCEHQSQCITPKTRAKVLPINPNYEELVEIRSRWEKPEIREQYRVRSQGERLINEAVRRGCRQARAWGLEAATLQANVAIIGNNLALLARRLARQVSQAA